MTATELLSILRRYPKACEVLGVKMLDEPLEAWSTENSQCLAVWWTEENHREAMRDEFHDWLLGRAARECDRLELHVYQDRECPSKFVRPTSQFAYKLYNTRLEGCLSALEEA